MSKKSTTRRDSLSVASRVKEYIRSRGYHAGADLPDAVSNRVVEILDAAIKRTDSNGRKTVKPGDL